MATKGKSDRLRLLLIDDDPMDREELRVILGKRYQIDEAGTGEQGWEQLLTGHYAAILLDLDLGLGMNGFDFLDRMRKDGLHLPVIIVSKTGSIENVVKAIRMGATNFVGKQAGGVEMELALQRALNETRIERDNLFYREQIDAAKGRFMSNSQAGKALLGNIERIAPAEVTVLITGETGAGKEVVAREIHRQSQRSERPFFVLDCTQIRDSLAESMLFGHERGAFSGAVKRNPGTFEAADEGTLFLDEIGELPLDLQPKLLRVLESGTFTRLGGQTELEVNVRVIAATHRDLTAEVAAGRFRQDLFYRLAVATLHVPALRERQNDISALANLFLAKLNAGRGGDPVRFEDQALMALTKYSWPGNVRELRNVVERCFLYTTDRTICRYLVLQNLPIDTNALPNYKDSKQQVLDAFERDYIRAALSISEGSVAGAAEMMEISRYGLQKAINRLGIGEPRSKA